MIRSNIDESFVKDLQEGVKKYLTEEAGIDSIVQKNAKIRLTNLRNKKSRLFDLFLENGCDKQTYEAKVLEIDQEIRLLEEKHNSLNKKVEDIFLPRNPNTYLQISGLIHNLRLINQCLRDKMKPEP